MSTSYRRHRKTKSSDSKKTDVLGARKSISFSEDSFGKATVTTNQLSNQRMTLVAQMYNNGPQIETFNIKRGTVSEPIPEPKVVVVHKPKPTNQPLIRLFLLFILVALVVSGFFFTPK